jgi:predicted transcriptional regulator
VSPLPPRFRSKPAKPSSKGAETLLGALELAVLRVAWSQPAVTVRDVLAVLLKQRPLAYKTVMTVMSRLS